MQSVIILLRNNCWVLPVLFTVIMAELCLFTDKHNLLKSIDMVVCRLTRGIGHEMHMHSLTKWCYLVFVVGVIIVCWGAYDYVSVEGLENILIVIMMSLIIITFVGILLISLSLNCDVFGVLRITKVVFPVLGIVICLLEIALVIKNYLIV